MAKPHTDHFDSPELAQEKAREALVPRTTAAPKSGNPALKRGLRVGLPATAVFLSLMAFSYPLFTKTEVSFTLSNDQVTESDGRVLTVNPRLTGVDKKDRKFVVTADQGEQEDPKAKRVSLTNIKASIDTGPDEAFTLSARKGLYRLEEEELSLTGDVILNSNKGMTLSMGGVDIDLNAKTANGAGNVVGTSRLGVIRAEQVAVDLLAKKGEFSGNVKLRITPATDKPKSPVRSDTEGNG